MPIEQDTERRFAELTGRLNHLDECIDRLRDEARDDIGRLRDETSKGFAAMGERMAKRETDGESLHKRLDTSIENQQWMQRLIVTSLFTGVVGLIVQVGLWLLKH